jgi:hypothetical protein
MSTIDPMSTAAMAFGYIVPQLFTIAVMIVGIIIAVVRRIRHPQVSLLLVIVLALQLATIIILPMLQVVVVRSGQPPATMSFIFGMWNFTTGMFGAVLVVLTLWAALGWRNQSSSEQNLD